MPVFVREHLNFWYCGRAYYLAKSTADFPFQIAMPVLYSSVVYYFTGQPLELHRYLYFNAIMVLVALVGQSLGLLLGIVFPMETAYFFGPFSMLPNILFSGFYISTATIPKFLRFLIYTSYLRFGFEGVLVATYGLNRTGMTCGAGSGAGSSLALSPELAQKFSLDASSSSGGGGGGRFCPTPVQVMEAMGVESDMLTNLVGLLAYFLFFRILGYVLLQFKLREPK